MSFVRLENLNDFIQPSTACVKPVEKNKPGVVTKVNDISLSDCLACSGCITSAESVLVQQQNYEEIFKVINQNKLSKSKKTIIVSLSLQSIASLAHKFSLDINEASERIAAFFISLGCDHVYDINLARHLTLVESYREFKSRWETKEKLPIISSVCPGWICYAEKTNGELIIPHLSKVRSPQQIMGALIKEKFCTANPNKRRNDIYHISLMPCFDKKLEASRQDFKDELDGSQDVDCVLTPVELEEILSSEGVSLLDFNPKKLDSMMQTDLQFDTPLTSHFGSVSGGYAENILLTSLRSLEKDNGETLTDRFEYSLLKNEDFIEVSFKNSSSGDLKLPRVAIANGFRNIQTVVQRLKRKALHYDYIEVMACPSGCINGGAQCRPKSGEDQTGCAKEAKKLYNEVPKVKHSIDFRESDNCKLYEKLNLNLIQPSDSILYTSFHSVPKMQNLTVNW